MRIAGASRPIPRFKQVDLVVTDCEFSSGTADDQDSDAFRRESRFTIPLALLDGDFRYEDLREMAQAFRASEQEPIDADLLLQLISDIVLVRQRHEAPPPQAMQADHARVERLTRREHQVLDHVVAGHPNKLTANALNISRRTVEHHRAAIMQKTRAKSVSALVRLALRTGLYDIADDGIA